MAAGTKRGVSESQLFSGSDSDYISDTLSKRSRESKGLPTCKAPSTSETRWLSRPCDNSVNVYIGKELKISTQVGGTVPTQLNVSVEFTRPASPSPQETCTCCSSNNCDRGNFRLWSLWDRNQTTGLSTGFATSREEREKQHYVNTYYTPSQTHYS